MEVRSLKYIFLIAATQCNNARTPHQRPVIYRATRLTASEISEEAMPRRSRLHIPQHHSRPGEEPDFSYLETSAAGAVPRPDVNARVRDIGNLAIEMVRVLDDSHVAIGPWNPHLEVHDLQIGLRHMLLTRIFDERMQRAQRQGKTSFYMRCLGEEAVSVAQGMALRPKDMLFPAYRNQGLYMVRGRPLVDLMCQLLSNTRDMCKGRQLPVMYHWAEGRIFSISGNLTTQFPQAVGWAMAAAIKGEDDIAASWIGEGSSAEADFHHAMLFASVYMAPVILNVVNNQWAISTFQGFAGGEQRSFAARGPGYGMAGIRVDGNDFLAVYAVTQWAAERARTGAGPTLIEHVTYRGAAHSTSDDPARYRPKDDYEKWPLGDPVIRLKNHLVALGEWSEERHKTLAEELETQVTESWKEAVQYGTLTDGPRLNRDLMFQDVFKEMPEQLRKQREQLRAEQGV
jgi:2-oxoisovalerate dehydrogenase E1 component alpha subunit